MLYSFAIKKFGFEDSGKRDDDDLWRQRRIFELANDDYTAIGREDPEGCGGREHHAIITHHKTGDLRL